MFYLTEQIKKRIYKIFGFNAITKIHFLIFLKDFDINTSVGSWLDKFTHFLFARTQCYFFWFLLKVGYTYNIYSSNATYIQLHVYIPLGLFPDLSINIFFTCAYENMKLIECRQFLTSNIWIFFLLLEFNSAFFSSFMKLLPF